MKKGIKFTLWVILIILVAIQFVPVDKENPIGDRNSDFLIVTQAPEDVQLIMRNACYDCHSNETIWPWYSDFAPVSFVIANHVEEGREHLNFSNWGNYESSDHPSILKHMKKEINKNAMPLAGYVKLHAEANISEDGKVLIMDWLDSVLSTYEIIDK